jgi:hypothetical protein
MPNIEIHGINFNTLCCSKLFKQIKAIFSNWPCAKDMVITIMDSAVTDLQGNYQPFLRVWDTDESEGKKIALRLRLEGFDVELPIRLAKFLPKPLYTFTEIEEEVRRMIYPGIYETILAQLSRGEVEQARHSFQRKLEEEPFCFLPPPTATELSSKVHASACGIESEVAIRNLFIRYHQMLAILGE